MSKTRDALEMYDKGGLSPYAVARAIGISTPTLYKAIKARKAKQERKHCPTCGQLLPDKKTIDT